MQKRIAVVGTGALGGYVGGHLAHHGHDVTLIDMWPEHIEAIRARGLELDGITPEEKFTVTRAKTMHLTEVQSLSKQKPIDIAFVAVKSYDTEWAATMIRPYLAADGCVVSLQNCMNEERIAHLVGWGKTLGVISSLISVELYEPGRIRRMVEKGGAEHTVFRVGEVHGVVTKRVEELVSMFSAIDSSKATTNLWGERWSKLCQNGMHNGVSAATGLPGRECVRNDALRRFSIKLGGEAVRVGQALGYQLVNLGKLVPVRGALNAIVGKDRRMAPPGTFVHAPAYARHAMKATEDGDCSYLYIKDKTWTVVGLAADEAVPDKAMTVDEVNRLHERGTLSRATGGRASRIIVDGLSGCYYPMLEALDAPQVSGRRVFWVEGERLAFGLFDTPGSYDEPEAVSTRETFVYAIGGKLRARVGRESRDVAAGDVIQIPRGTRYRLQPASAYVRYALVCSTPYLEQRIDGMNPAEREQARLHNRAN